MKILIDADGCPVVKKTIEIAEKYKIKVIILCDTAHIFNYEGIDVCIASKGADSTDFMLVNKAYEGDIVVTGDYGLAVMCLAKKAIPINQNGFLYTEENIDDMLFSRHISKKLRRAGKKCGHIKKRTSEDDEAFEKCIESVILTHFNSF